MDRNTETLLIARKRPGSTKTEPEALPIEREKERNSWIGESPSLKGGVRERVYALRPLAAFGFMKAMRKHGREEKKKRKEDLQGKGRRRAWIPPKMESLDLYLVFPSIDGTIFSPRTL